jgi:hypothetical protein
MALWVTCSSCAALVKLKWRAAALEIADGDERRKALDHGLLRVRAANRSYEKRSFVGKPGLSQIYCIRTAVIQPNLEVVAGPRWKPRRCEEL